MDENQFLSDLLGEKYVVSGEVRIILTGSSSPELKKKGYNKYIFGGTMATRQELPYTDNWVMSESKMILIPRSFYTEFKGRPYGRLEDILTGGFADPEMWRKKKDPKEFNL